MHVSDPLAKLVHQTAHHSRWESVMNDGESSNQRENICDRYTQCSLPLPLLLLSHSPSFTVIVKWSVVDSQAFHQSFYAFALITNAHINYDRMSERMWKERMDFYHGVFMFFHENSFLAGTQTNVYHMTNTRQSILAGVPCFASDFVCIYRRRGWTR